MLGHNELWLCEAEMVRALNWYLGQAMTPEGRGATRVYSVSQVVKAGEKGFELGLVEKLSPKKDPPA